MSDPVTEPASGAQPGDDAIQRAVIDRSTKLPVLFFITSGVSWLLVATLAGFIASVKIFYPGFLDQEWLFWMHYGRLQPAFTTAFIYGWGFNAAFGVMIWMVSRLSRVPLRNPWTLVTAGHLWNVAVLLGFISILAGGSTSLEWLEFPTFVWVTMLAAYALIAVWMVIMFRVRQEQDSYISLWYLIGAAVWFPWVFATANLLLRHSSGGGVAAAAVNAWYTSNLVLLWFVPVGLASLYFIIPKITGRPVFSYHLAKIGFWSLAALAGWTGVQKLMGGPLPVWMPGISSAATIMILIPIGTVAINHHFTVQGRHDLVGSSPSLRFSFMAGFALTGWAVLMAAMAFFGIAQFTQFTIAVEGANMLVLYGFFTMAMFGAIYFVVPRLVGCEWFSAKIIRQHFWFSVYGIAAMVVVLVGGGMAQGDSIGTWDRGAVGAVEISRGWLVGRSVAWVFIGFSNLMFLLHLTLMILRLGRRSQQPTLLRDKLVAADGKPVSASAH